MSVPKTSFAPARPRRPVARLAVQQFAENDRADLISQYSLAPDGQYQASRLWGKSRKNQPLAERDSQTPTQ